MYITLLNNYTRKYIYLRLNLLVYFFPPSLYLFTFLSYLSINNLATNIQLRIFSRRDNDKISRIATSKEGGISRMRGNDNIGEKWAWNKEIEERESFRRFREGNPYERCFQPTRKYTRKILVSRIRGAEVNIIVGFDASNDDETGYI